MNPLDELTDEEKRRLAEAREELRALIARSPKGGTKSSKRRWEKRELSVLAVIGAYTVLANNRLAAKAEEERRKAAIEFQKQEDRKRQEEEQDDLRAQGLKRCGRCKKAISNNVHRCPYCQFYNY